MYDKFFTANSRCQMSAAGAREREGVVNFSHIISDLLVCGNLVERIVQGISAERGSIVPTRLFSLDSLIRTDTPGIPK